MRAGPTVTELLVDWAENPNDRSRALGALCWAHYEVVRSTGLAMLRIDVASAVGEMSSETGMSPARLRSMFDVDLTEVYREAAEPSLRQTIASGSLPSQVLDAADRFFDAVERRSKSGDVVVSITEAPPLLTTGLDEDAAEEIAAFFETRTGEDGCTALL